ncbi:hypothetical protein [Acidithiobacillus ferrooxidans]|uniref:hypothetical protein n=2 Tax=Acidithiobacillus TaxID=119977 RepID=UPI0019D6B668|nr:hypothetical protein [Acidithiobacillus ferrooxidans]
MPRPIDVVDQMPDSRQMVGFDDLDDRLHQIIQNPLERRPVLPRLSPHFSRIDQNLDSAIVPQAPWLRPAVEDSFQNVGVLLPKPALHPMLTPGGLDQLCELTRPPGRLKDHQPGLIGGGCGNSASRKDILNSRRHHLSPHYLPAHMPWLFW